MSRARVGLHNSSSALHGEGLSLAAAAALFCCGCSGEGTACEELLGETETRQGKVDFEKKML